MEGAVNAIAYSPTSVIEDAGSGELILIWRFILHMESQVSCELNIQLCQLINDAEIWWYKIMLKCENNLFWYKNASHYVIFKNLAIVNSSV